MWLLVNRDLLLIFGDVIFVESGSCALTQALLKGLSGSLDSRNEARVARRVVRYLCGTHSRDNLIKLL